MNKKIIFAITIILTLLQLLLSQTPISVLFSSILVSTWIILYVFGFKSAIYFIILAGIIFEFFTFKYIGMHGFTFSLTLLVIFFTQNSLSLFRSEKSFTFNFSGLLCNTIIFLIIGTIIAKEVLIINIILNLVLNSLLFFVISKLHKAPKFSDYV